MTWAYGRAADTARARLQAAMLKCEAAVGGHAAGMFCHCCAGAGAGAGLVHTVRTTGFDVRLHDGWRAGRLLKELWMEYEEQKTPGACGGECRV